MSHTLVNYHDVEPVGGGLHFLRDPLGCENLGVSVRELDPGRKGKEHDHAHDGQEEVYVLLSGSLTIVVEGEPVSMEAGDALRVSPEDTRQVENGDDESLLVVAGAP